MQQEPQKKVKWSPSSGPSLVKTKLICFFDISRIVHAEFVLPGRTVNRTFYLEVLKRLCNSMWQKTPNLWETKDWFFHHGNAPAHASISMRNVLAKNGKTSLLHAPFLTDLAPCEFFLFPRMKRSLKEHQLDKVNDIKAKSEDGACKHTGRRIWKMFQKMATQIGEVLNYKGSKLKV